jgi:hypothetical protein
MLHKEKGEAVEVARSGGYRWKGYPRSVSVPLVCGTRRLHATVAARHSRPVLCFYFLLRKKVERERDTGWIAVDLCDMLARLTVAVQWHATCTIHRMGRLVWILRQLLEPFLSSPNQTALSADAPRQDPQKTFSHIQDASDGAKKSSFF